MHINTNVDGALVYLNGEEVGRTPLAHPFMWYGNYDVELRKDGYATRKLQQKVGAPWWQWVPFDLMADLLPGKKVDAHYYHYLMASHENEAAANTGEMHKSMLNLRSQLESGKYTRTPATLPATAPATPAAP